MKKLKNKGVNFLLSSVFFIPFYVVFFVIGLHSNELVKKPIHCLMFILLFITIAILLTSIYLIKHSTNEKWKETKKWLKIGIITFLSIEWISASTFLGILYGPYKGFREWLISTAMTTMNHQYFATWFYSQSEIQEVLDNNQIIESGEDTNPDLIDTEEKQDPIIYANEYEEAILSREKDAAYKIIPIKGDGYTGYLVAIYNPESVGVATTKYINNKGQYVMEMAAEEQALVAMNGGGFIDPNYSSNGGIPHGIVIKNGKIISNHEYTSTGGLIGLTNDNKLILGKMNAREALNKGVRDAVTFGPFLIVNGKRSFIKGNGGWGSAPRSAIGQRQDGIILFLVIDGRKIKKPGADMVDLTDIMENYGAVNAANLDGGTSSVIVFPQDVAKNYINDEELARNCRKEYCYINDPIDGGGSHATRWIPTSFIVKNLEPKDDNA